MPRLSDCAYDACDPRPLRRGAARILVASGPQLAVGNTRQGDAGRAVALRLPEDLRLRDRMVPARSPSVYPGPFTWGVGGRWLVRVCGCGVAILVTPPSAPARIRVRSMWSARAWGCGGAATTAAVGSWCVAACSAPARIKVAESGGDMRRNARLCPRCGTGCPGCGDGARWADRGPSAGLLPARVRARRSSEESPRPAAGPGDARPLPDPRGGRRPGADGDAGGSPPAERVLPNSVGSRDQRRDTPPNGLTIPITLGPA